jgi:hypothetical protein
MKVFTCQGCGQLVYFENMGCERCGRRLGYLPEQGMLSAVDPDGALWVALAAPGARYRFCANWEYGVCNWLVAAADDSAFCAACSHNGTVPDIHFAPNLILWQRIEEAKRRLFYTLLKLRLPVPTAAGGDPEPLVFNFLTDPPVAEGTRVFTGHDNGVITISLREADDAERERMRTAMGEPYRTLLGHFRHEIGHYYWDRLVRDGGRLDEFRALIGDERANYAEAVQRHYADGPPADWQQSFVSAYATTHPWEDWAETWAHYFHIVDAGDGGRLGLKVSPRASDEPTLEAEIDFDPHRARGMSRLIEAWLPLTFAVNSLNRAMGQPDLYPFVLPAAAIEKLTYVHRVIHRANVASGVRSAGAAA